MSLSNKTKIPYALSLDSHHLVGVDDGVQGLSCNCICPSCSIRLEAIQGNIRIHHFRHHDKAADDCKYSYWVSVRDLAKQIFRELKYIQCKNTPVDSKKAVKDMNARYKFDILEEKKLHEKYGMDIFFISDIGLLGITFLTPEKRERNDEALSSDANYHILEVDLTSIQNMQNYTINALKELIENPNSKRFVFPTSSIKNIELQEDKDYVRLYRSKSIMDMEDFRAFKINTILLNSFEQRDFSAINVAKLYYKNMLKRFCNIEADDDCKEIHNNGLHSFYQCKDQYYGVVAIQNKYHIYQVLEEKIILIDKCLKKEKIVHILTAFSKEEDSENADTKATNKYLTLFDFQ